MSTGVAYIVLTIMVIFVLMFFFPQVLGIDLAGAMRGERVVGVLRMALGAVVLAYFARVVARIVGTCTLEGEDWHAGLRNARGSLMLERVGLTLVLLLLGGVALVAWGAIGAFA